jgi:uncharacterized protein (TIGR02996 family)
MTTATTTAADELARVREALAQYDPWPLPPVRPDVAMEDAFLRDALARPDDDVPLLVFADWLDDRDDLRAAPTRLLARLRAARRALPMDAVEAAPATWPAPPSVPSDPQERFDDGSRALCRLASQEAMRLNHEYSGTQHLLLAFAAVETFAARKPGEWGLPSYGDVKAVVERITPTVPDMIIMGGRPPLTPRMKTALQFAVQEAVTFDAPNLTADHLLLGLCRTAPSVATAALRLLGVTPASVCEHTLYRLGREPMPWLHGRPEVW